jgi:hypothetical protein
MRNFGKLTIKGSSDFELKLSQVLENIALDVELLINKDLYEAIILIGGYGRGEGGVVLINGEEFPHNNFDFLVISNEISQKDKAYLSEKCQIIFDMHTKPLGILVEFSVISSLKLKNCEPLVITYDMKYGHKLICGNAISLVKNKNFELQNIPSWDIRNLIVNRGTLLIINDLMLKKDNLDKKNKKIIIKHWIKAIIGYGDALLFYLGDYNYSYVEKQKRMKEQKAVSIKFKNIYEEAMNFRFEPDYEKYLDFNFKEYQSFLKIELSKIHTNCEKLALNKVKINSPLYISKVVDETLNTNRTLKGILKKIYFLTKKVPNITSMSFLENIKFRMLGIKGMMPILFPYVAYDMKNKVFDKILKDFFKLDIKNKDAYKISYLKYWKTYVNTNFVKEDFGL